MKMDVYDWQRLYNETVERFNTIFDELKDAIERAESACESSSDENIREQAFLLSSARTSAEAELEDIRQLGEVMTML